jgi:hypothetical protein
MSNPGNADPIAGLENVGEDAVREHAARLVVGGGTTIEAANQALQKRGFAPIQGDVREYHEQRKAALTDNAEFRSKVLAGDVEANARLLQLDIAITNARPGRMTDKAAPLASREYDGMRRTIGYNTSSPELAQAYETDIGDWLAKTGMPGRNAEALMADHFEATKQTAAMDEEQRGYWADRELRFFLDAIGGEQVAKAASQKLAARASRPIDLVTICRSNGSRVALTLYFQSQIL